MALRIRTFALDRTTPPTSETELTALAERVREFSIRAEAALLEAARRSGPVAQWGDEDTFVTRVRAFLVAVGRSRAIQEAASGSGSLLDDGDESDGDQLERLEEEDEGDEEEARAAAGEAAAAGTSPPQDVTVTPTPSSGSEGAGNPAPALSAARAASLPPSEPARSRGASSAASVSSRRSETSPLASLADFVSESVGPDGRTAFEREVRAVIKATRLAAEEAREREEEARVERLRKAAGAARPANDGRARYGRDHPTADRYRVRVFPSQDGDGDLRMPIILDQRPETPPELSELNRWQRRSCAACSKAITTGSWRVLTGAERRARYCSYTELLFCEECFVGWIPEAVARPDASAPKCEHPLPWRVVHALDTSKQPVCAAAEAFLRSLWRQPIVDVTAVGIGASTRSRTGKGARNIRLMVALRRRAAQLAAQLDSVLADKAEQLRAAAREAGAPEEPDPAMEAGLVREDGMPVGTSMLRSALVEGLPERFAYFAVVGPELVAPAHFVGVARGGLLDKLEAVVDIMTRALEAARRAGIA